jgi:hypothetical protein
MWESLINVSEGAWESVSETAEVYVRSYAEAKAQDKAAREQEARRNPDVLNQVEPKTAMNTDGSTIVEPTVHQPQPMISGVSNKVLMIGGSAVVGLVVLGLLYAVVKD